MKGTIQGEALSQLIQSACERFYATYGRPTASVGIAPGRIELLGNHTDYNEGFVLGLAVDRYVAVAAGRNDTGLVAGASTLFSQHANFNPQKIEPDPDNRWLDYIKGVVLEFLRRDLEIPGIDLYVESSVPLGSGMSSSAALLLATAHALNEILQFGLDPMTLAKMCHVAERDFVGANNGFLDHACSAFGKIDHTIFLDCRTEEYERIPLPFEEVSIAVCQTNVKHSVVSGEYQTRRKECAVAVEYFRKQDNQITALRDVNIKQITQAEGMMANLPFRRARHVVSENARVLKGLQLLKNKQLHEFGNLLNAAHESCKVDFENSCRELDAMVDIAQSAPGVLGAKLIGGGFGGCALVLVETDANEALKKTVLSEYPKRVKLDPEVMFCQVVDGAKAVSHPA